MKNERSTQNRRTFLKSSTSALAGLGLVAVGGINITACEENNVEDENNGNTDGGESETNPFNFKTQTVLLNSGYEMPILGIGTFRLSNSQAEESVYHALLDGYRLIDTADIYGNENGVGEGIRRSGVPREEIFLTTKLWTADYANAQREIDERLSRLGLDYIDLLLLHHPAANDQNAYRAMEEAVEQGKVRSIGLSNYYEVEFREMMGIATITPAVVQNETHPYNQGRNMKEFLELYGTILESWFPLGGRGTGNTQLFNDATIMDIANAHGKSSAQVILRWHLQTGNIAIPGSSNPDHIQENFEIFDFELTNAEMQILNGLDRQQRFSSY